eukprot:6176079-Pleurochrysis_carterae.AAC.2
MACMRESSRRAQNFQLMDRTNLTTQSFASLAGELWKPCVPGAPLVGSGAAQSTLNWAKPLAWPAFGVCRPRLALAAPCRRTPPASCSRTGRRRCETASPMGRTHSRIGRIARRQHRHQPWLQFEPRSLPQQEREDQHEHEHSHRQQRCGQHAYAHSEETPALHLRLYRAARGQANRSPLECGCSCPADRWWSRRGQNHHRLGERRGTLHRRTQCTCCNGPSSGLRTGISAGNS